MKAQVGLILMLLIAIRNSASAAPGEREVIHPSIGDPIVTTAVTYINEFYQSRGDFAQRKPVRVLYATKQVVSGVLYALAMRVEGGPGLERCRVEYVDQSTLPNRYSLHKNVKCREEIK